MLAIGDGPQNLISRSSMVSFLETLFSFPLLAIQLAWSAMGFGVEPFLEVAASPRAQRAALLIAFMAGVSEMLGQSVILVINRVPVYRFLASLAYTGLSYVITAIIWTLSTFAVAPLTQLGLLEMTNIASVTGVLALAFAPRLFGVFSLAPYIGVIWGNLLEVWAMALAIFGLHMAIGLPVPAALFCGGVGWIASYYIRGHLGRALRRPLHKIRILISGTRLERTPQQLIDEAIATLKQVTPHDH